MIVLFPKRILYHFLQKQNLQQCFNGKYFLLKTTLKVYNLKKKKKRLKFIEYVKSKLESNGVLFLQETHSISNDENAWADDFKSQDFFSHGTSKSCGVLIAYLGSKSFVVKNKRNDDAGGILILHAWIHDNDYISANDTHMENLCFTEFSAKIHWSTR